MINELNVGMVVETLEDMSYTECDGLEKYDQAYLEDGFIKKYGNYIIPKGTKMIYVGEIGSRGMDLFVIGRGQYEFAWIELGWLKDITRYQEA